MDLGSLLFSRCVVMAFLLEAVHSSNGGQTSCSCREIPPWNFTEPPPKTESFNINETFRYKCIEGYVRKAGTSNLTKCKQKTISEAEVCEWWMPLPLQCIPDPKNPPSATVTEGLADFPHNSIITTTVTAASTSQQMTQSVSTSASVTTETESTLTASPGLQVPSNHPQAAASTSQQMTQSVSTSASVTTETESTLTASPGLQVPSNHPQAAASTSQQMTQSVSTSASVTTETESTLTASPGLQVPSNHPQATTEKEGAISTPPPTLTNTEPPNSRTNSHLFKFSSTTTTAITLAPLVIICAGIGVLCYIWRNKKNNRKGKRKTEEEMPMNPLP